MNFENVVQSREQDEYSLSGAIEGIEGQLQVVGWNGRSKGGHKLYLWKCSICSQDSELFGEGVFRSVKGDVVRGKYPCGCSSSPQWTQAQYYIRCARRATILGFKFIAFVSTWDGCYTKICMECEKHGEWDSSNINNLLTSGVGCPRCHAEATSEGMLKPDDEVVASFLDTGAFHPDTKFWRSSRKDTRGYPAYWYVSCPICGEQGEAITSTIRAGSRTCACSPHHQREAYVNWILDGGDPIAIKFGIANTSKLRIKRQDRLSVYQVRQCVVYTFPTTESCKKAERDCKQELDCGIVLKRDMPDGYTETTWVYNLDKIIEIYERNGGILNDK